MKYKKIKLVKTKVVKTAVIVAAMFMCLLIGCSKEEDAGQKNGNNLITENTDWQGDSVTEESQEQNSMEETQENREEHMESESTGETQSNQEEQDMQQYPQLKADGASWGLKYLESGMQPWGNEKVDVLAEYNAYFVGDKEEKVIYLTFDCGYENGNTEKILAALEKYEVTGTFFITGNFLEKQQELLKKIVEKGHAVGSHSYTHPDITQLPDEDAFREELDKVKTKFEEVTGEELSMYFRPPEGKCYSETLQLSKEMGYATIFWSLAHVDWNTNNQPDPESAIKTLTERIHPGAIVLLHNTSSTNGEIIDELIGKWIEMGYTIKPLSHLIEQNQTAE